HLFDALLQPQPAPPDRRLTSLPLPHGRDERRRHGIVVAGADRIVEVLERLSGPEHLLETIGELAGTREYVELLEDDRPGPHRRQHKADNDELDDEMGLEKERKKAEIARRRVQRVL